MNWGFTSPFYFKLLKRYMEMNKIDFIGDIHGYSEKLKMLLYKLGYSDDKGYFHHPDRQVVFVGDYIDRGPDNIGVVDIVERMVDNGSAKALMGNHEYNAILFNTLGKKGYLRPHLIKNYKQHSETLLQYLGKQKEYDDMIKWFKTLPLYIETDEYRACHACFDNQSIQFLKKHTNEGILTDDQFVKSAKHNTNFSNAVEVTCKGLEVRLPSGSSFNDKDGTERHDIRVKWWENPQGKTYKQMSVISDIKMEKNDFDIPMNHYANSQVPVFFGHYWLKGTPKLLKKNICCLDYSVAKNGYLVAYRWDGEKSLLASNLVWV